MTDTTTPTRIAFLGAGNIAGPYADSVGRHPELQLVGVFDVDSDKAKQFAVDHDCALYGSLDELAADAPQIVVNLSSAPYHYATTSDLIARGLTVFSEKPLALAPREALELVRAAEQRGVRLAGAPSLWLGAPQQEAARTILSGGLGHIGLVRAEVNQGRIETWHPAPASFYQVGPVFDAGVYPITYLTAVLGPIRQVAALSSMSIPNRVTLAGDPFTPPSDDTWAVNAIFESGALLSLTCNFFVDSATQPRNLIFHGEKGSLLLEDWLLPGSGISFADYGDVWSISRAPHDAPADWSLGVLDLADAIRTGRPHLNGAAHAAHVVEVLDGIAASERDGVRVSISSSFPSPFSDVPTSTR